MGQYTFEAAENAIDSIKRGFRQVVLGFMQNGVDPLQYLAGAGGHLRAADAYDP